MFADMDGPHILARLLAAHSMQSAAAETGFPRTALCRIRACAARVGEAQAARELCSRSGGGAADGHAQRRSPPHLEAVQLPARAGQASMASSSSNPKVDMSRMREG